MYKPFSDKKNIEKMTRVLDVFSEEETLKATLLNWKDNPYGRNLDNWVKYVSTGSKNPREFFLYWDAKTEDEFLTGVASDLSKKKTYFTELENYFLTSYKNFQNFTDNLFEKDEKFYGGLSATQLVSLLRKFSYFHKRALAGYYIAYDLSLLLPRLLKKEGVEDKLLQNFTCLGIASIVMTEKQEFLKNLEKIQKIAKKDDQPDSEKFNKIIFKHWYKFGGSSFNHHNKNYSLDDYKRKFKRLKKLNPTFELRKIKLAGTKDEAVLQKDFRKIRGNKKISKYVKWMRIAFKYRNCDAEYYHNYFSHSQSLFKEVARRLNLKDFDDLWLLSKQEILDGILMAKKIEKIIRNRKEKGITIKQIGRTIKVLTGVKKEDWHERKIEKAREFNGSCAYKGCVKGTVKVIFNTTENDVEFMKGEILVAPMTTPEFVPLMKKCKAIVTDEGGLLCHAAIVAREFKIPCLIGTKIATAVLKNGDLIEVDAYKGTVKLCS